MPYKDKIKRAEYNHKHYLENMETRKEQSRKSRLNNPNYNLEHSEYRKKTNYASEKTPEQRLIRAIKRKTNEQFPLFKCYACIYCGQPAENHHHNTRPIEYNKFELVCKKCHNRIHGGVN